MISTEATASAIATIAPPPVETAARNTDRIMGPPTRAVWPGWT